MCVCGCAYRNGACVQLPSKIMYKDMCVYVGVRIVTALARSCRVKSYRMSVWHMSKLKCQMYVATLCKSRRRLRAVLLTRMPRKACPAASIARSSSRSGGLTVTALAVSKVCRHRLCGVCVRGVYVCQCVFVYRQTQSQK